MANGNALIAALRGASGVTEAPQSDAPMFQSYTAPWQDAAVPQMPSFAAPAPKQATGPSIADIRSQRMTDAAAKSAQIQQLRNQQMNGPFPEYYNRDTDSWEQNTNAYVGPNTSAQPWYPADMPTEMPPGVALPPPMRTDTPTWGEYNGQWMWAYPDEMAAMGQTQQPAAPEAPSYQPPAQEQPQYQEVYDREADAWMPSYQDAPQQQYTAPEAPSYQAPAQGVPQQQEYTEGPIWGFNEREGQWMWYDPNDTGQVYR